MPAIPFAILHHTGIVPEHFDLLIAFPDEPLLRTWRILTPPNTWPQNPPHAQRQPDHRQIYLTFEGDISNHRGHVRRILEGTATLLEQSSTTCTPRLTANSTGEPFDCTITLPLH